MKVLNRRTAPTPQQRPIRVLQFGEGNFLRAFADWMVDLLNEGGNFEGDIQIVQPIPNGMSDLINQQNGLYHVLLEGLENGEKHRSTRLISCVRNVLNPYTSYSTFLELAQNPDLEFIFSNTTEAGIRFEADDLDYTRVPSTYPAKLTALLYHRFKQFGNDIPSKMYILPCELIESNGDTLKAMVLRYIAFWKLSTAFESWIGKHVFFCNTLVDRIVSGFPKESIHEVQKALGYSDALVVKAEPFHLWVIEGPEELQQRLPFRDVGLNVIFTDDLAPFRTRKVRILNGAHTALVTRAYLQGFTEVKRAMEDEEIDEFLHSLIFHEIIPTLDLPKEELEAYANEVLDRFRNPFVVHKLLDIALNSVSKFRVRVLPSLLIYKKRFGRLPEKLIESLAYLLVFYRGKYGEREIPRKDDPQIISFFDDAWAAGKPELSVKILLSNDELWGIDLGQIEGLENAVLDEVVKIIKLEPSF